MSALAHAGNRAGRYGFVVWNEFQALHFASLLNRVEQPVVLLVTDRATQDFVDRVTLIELRLGASIVSVKESDLIRFDGILDGIFSQTNFKGADRFTHTPLFALQYSMTKEAHQYGAWHMDFSAAFCYGEYSARKMSYACMTFPCGHPRLSRGPALVDPDLVAQYKAQLDPEKPTILYAPTWGVGGLVEEFLAQIDWLRERYNVIVRPHHNTISRELSRIGLSSLPSRPFLTEDFPTQCSVSDLVVSDYSGAIFDALYLGKPVLLFRDETVAAHGRSSFSIDSIEVARRSDIGPLATNAAELREILGDRSLSFCDAYRERNQRLIEESFVFGADPAVRIMEIVDALRLTPADIPQQRWLRSHVKRKVKLATLKASKAKSARKSKMRPARSRGLPENCLRIVRSLYHKIAGRVLSRRRFLVPYLRLRSRLKHGPYVEKAANLLVNIGEYRVAAEVLAPLARNSQRIEDSFFRLWIRGPGNQVSRQRVDDFCRSFDCARLTPTAKLRLAVCTNDLDNFEITGEALEDIASREPARVAVGISALMTLRRYEEIESAVWKNPSLLEFPPVLRALKRIISSSHFLGDLKKYAVQANNSHGREAAPDSELAIYLPPHFFGAASREMRSKRARNWEEIRSLYQDVFAALELDCAPSFRVKHQYFMNLVDAREDIPAISFFTKGGGLKNWHMKDVGLGKLVSMDPDGFLSSSMLAKISPNEIESALAEADDDLGVFGRAADLFDRHGGDKYLKLGTSHADSTQDDYVFVALQSTKGLEETFQPVEELIRVLARYSRKSGRNVVFKRHPLCEDVLIERALTEASTSPSVRVSSVDTWQLVKGSSAVVTVNSGVALQAIAAQKRLIISGPSEMGVVAERVNSFNEVPALLSEPPVGSSLTRRYAKYLEFYLEHYLVDPSRHLHFLDRLQAIVSITESATSRDQVRKRYFGYLVEGFMSKRSAG